jgi:uncharacterized protein YbgA (DUF1722 family)
MEKGDSTDISFPMNLLRKYTGAPVPALAKYEKNADCQFKFVVSATILRSKKLGKMRIQYFKQGDNGKKKRTTMAKNVDAHRQSCSEYKTDNKNLKFEPVPCVPRGARRDRFKKEVIGNLLKHGRPERADVADVAALPRRSRSPGIAALLRAQPSPLAKVPSRAKSLTQVDKAQQMIHYGKLPDNNFAIQAGLPAFNKHPRDLKDEDIIKIVKEIINDQPSAKRQHAKLIKDLEQYFDSKLTQREKDVVYDIIEKYKSPKRKSPKRKSPQSAKKPSSKMIHYGKLPDSNFAIQAGLPAFQKDLLTEKDIIKAVNEIIEDMPESKKQKSKLIKDLEQYFDTTLTANEKKLIGDIIDKVKSKSLSVKPASRDIDDY